MRTPNLITVWWMPPHHPDTTFTIAASHGHDRRYSYYQRHGDGPWQQVAYAATEHQATHWYANRHDPIPVDAATAAWLDVEATKALGGAA
jgi:hypothetical protein